MTQQLLFDYMDLRYALPAEAIEGVHWLPAIVAVPDLPAYFAGLMNLHGTIVPVVDLARRFGRASRPYRSDQCVLLLRDDTRTTGLLADRVIELADIPDDIVEPYVQVEGAAPYFSPSVIRGTVQWHDGVAILIDAGALVQLMFDITREARPDVEPSPLFAPAEPAEIERLRLRTQQLASPLALPEERPNWYALVTVNECRFAIDLRRVSEFAHLGTCTPVPCCPEHILGCINLRGSIIAVLDVAPLLLGTPARDSREVVILELAGQRVGLAVHEVTDVSAFPVSATTELSGQAFGHPHARQLLQIGEDVAEILDLDALLREGLLEVKENV